MNGAQIFVGIMALLLYFLPSFIASNRNHKNTAGIVILNIFLGWTLIGWVAALIWAVSNPTAATEPAPAGASPSPVTRPCPECAEQILPVARKCKHCGAAVDPTAT